MSATLILGILQLMLQEAETLAAGTKAAPEVAIVAALTDTIGKVQAKIAADAELPIDLDSLRHEDPIE